MSFEIITIQTLNFSQQQLQPEQSELLSVVPSTDQMVNKSKIHAMSLQQVLEVSTIEKLTVHHIRPTTTRMLFVKLDQTVPSVALKKLVVLPSTLKMVFALSLLVQAMAVKKVQV